MKKRVTFFSILLILTLIIPLAIAADALNVTNSNDDVSKVRNAYSCLENKIEGVGCDSLSSEEKVFTLLATGDCESEVKDDSKFESDIKYTSQAILALEGKNDSEEWLLNQKEVPTNLAWYLQIDSSNPTTCKITYAGNPFTININKDKKISSSAGSCLTPSQGNYWLRISPSCYSEEFLISCNDDFITNLLFQKTGSSTIHVSSETNSASSEGTTKEKVNSFCFEEGGECDYEGSLWATAVLNKDYNMDSFIPYLVTNFEDTENKKFIPEAFLYGIGDESFKSLLLQNQKSNKWWSESGDKYYDTAVALLSLGSLEPEEKTNSINWLLDEAQDSDGCFNNGNIRDTAFLLYSIWPETISRGSLREKIDCEDSGSFCHSKLSCQTSGGVEIDSLYCPRHSDICCSVEKELKSCSAKEGSICSSDKVCNGGNKESEISDNLSGGEFCCLGTCAESTTTTTTLNECGDHFGTCGQYCGNGEEEVEYACDYSSEICCVPKTTNEGTSYTLVWVLVSLIILVILGIVFRSKLLQLWIRIKSKFGGKKGPVQGRRPPFGRGIPPRRIPLRRPSSRMPMRAPPRRILPPQRQRPPVRKPSPTKRPKGDLDDVLKKLKEMGK